jgi:H+/Cl- antiporter ClcA
LVFGVRLAGKSISACLKKESGFRFRRNYFYCLTKYRQEMKIQKNQNIAMKLQQFPLLFYLFKWLFLSAISGACIGSASALLLVSLEWATQYREHHLWIIALLPVAGLVIGLMYHYLAGTASRGNNFLIE